VEVTNTCGTYKDEFNTIKVDYTGTNLVTANYDQLNDQLVIDNNSPFKGKIKIYSIWGDCVFQSNQYQNNWPKENTPSGVYYYEFEIENCAPFHSWVQVIK
jgi:hypothetical protein